MWATERSRNGGLDRLPVPGLPGALWLAGKHLVGPDPDAALERTGATRLVCLVERHELVGRYPDYVAWLAQDPRAQWHPIPDLCAPSLDALAAMADDLVEHLVDGSDALVHCGAGFGRAGTTAAAVLIRCGADVDEAIAAVAAARPLAGPEAGSQRDVLRALAET